MKDQDLKQLIAQMTLEEKAGICSGADFWNTKGVERLGIAQSLVSDGPHGLRKQDSEGDHLGLNESIKAVCFPAGCATASSFDRQLIREMGETLGKECQAEQISVMLGPAMNIKRSPLCGRNFEYLSEDPFLAGEIASAFIQGVQSQNIGTSPKHFCLNNQETRRMSCSSECDERTMREIYLTAFEKAVKQSKPWTIMCSYNKINGVYAAQNRKLLTDVLRKEWGFDGYVVSDWGATDRRVPDLKAGMDLEMPGSGGVNDQLIVEAVQNGTLEQAVLDEAVFRILKIVCRYEENKRPDTVFDRDADHLKAQQVAEQSMVLLKNDGILPLSEGDSIAFIGKYAKYPRIQGGGSSHINCHKIASALEAAEGIAGISFAQGFQDETDEIDTALEQEAILAAKHAKVAVIFAGLPDNFESEGYDRTHIRIPDCQNHLIQEILKVQPNTVILLHNGSPIEMPWADQVKGILECYLSGQAIGLAQVNILFGKVNPSGKLAETFPLRLEDTPCYLSFPGEGDRVEYREGIFVGYRYYDSKKMDVLFPFGHGLSYTNFTYQNLKIDKSQITEDETVSVSVDVCNTGKVFGKEIVQLYITDQQKEIIRPEKELKGFEKVALNPGETKTVTFRLDRRAFAYWNVEANDWMVQSGDFQILIGKSSRAIELSETITVVSAKKPLKTITPDTTLGDIMGEPALADDLNEMMASFTLFEKQETEEANEDPGAMNDEMMDAMMRFMPLRGVISFGGGKINMADIHTLCDRMNQRLQQSTNSDRI